VVAPWNYPYLTAVNAVIPALMAGNAVLLKHSAQTPLCAERFFASLRAGGLPKGLFQFLHLSHDDTTRIIKDPRIAFVAFTGSVPLTRKYRLGDPLDADTNLGPVVRASAAAEIRKQVARSVRAGARPLIDGRAFRAQSLGRAYVAPQLLEVRDNRNPVMQDECFGPVAGIMKVRSDDEAVRLMNDNAF